MNRLSRILILAGVSLVTVGALATGLSRCFSSETANLAGPEGTTPDGETAIGVAANEQPGETNTAEAWADDVMKTMTPRQRVAQLFIPRWEADGATSQATMKQHIDAGIGGFLLGKGTLNAHADIINRAQSLAKVPLMVTLDGEWGLSMRISGTPRFPKNIALGAIQDEKLLEEYGREVARECKLMGIQVDFAPVLDVNSNPNNPVIGYRSFGEDPKRVAALGAAYCRGMEAGGVMSVGKHFPGHGDTSVDSHKALPTVDHSKAQLEQIDFVPFVESIKAGMSGVMVGHLRVPALDKSGTPASLSKVITTDVLRNQLGFRGLIFTDALAMKGAVNANENNCVSAFKAGADVLLSSASPMKDIQAVVDAVKAGKISQQEVDRRCRKLLIYKYNLGLVTPTVIKKEGLAGRLNFPEAKGLLDRLAKASITVLANKNNLLPLAKLDQTKIAVISLGAPASNQFASTCAKYTSVTNVGVTSAADATKAVNAAKNADVVIVGVFKNDTYVKNAFAQLSKASKQFAPVFFINPFKMRGFTGLSQLPELVVAYDDTPELYSAAAQALFGGIDVSGRFPVNIQGVGSIGDGVDLKKKD